MDWEWLLGFRKNLVDPRFFYGKWRYAIIFEAEELKDFGFAMPAGFGIDRARDCASHRYAFI